MSRLALYFVGVGGFVLSGSLLAAVTHTRTDYLLAAFAALNLGLVGVVFGVQLGISRTIHVLHATRPVREAEQAILTAALTLAGNLAQADVDGVAGPLTGDERRLIEAVAGLPEIPGP